MDCRADYCAALRAQPCGSTVMGHELLKASKERASGCMACRERAADDLMRFGLLFSSEVNEAVAKVTTRIFGRCILN